jgi:hypothetical protein
MCVCDKRGNSGCKNCLDMSGKTKRSKDQTTKDHFFTTTIAQRIIKSQSSH